MAEKMRLEIVTPYKKVVETEDDQENGHEPEAVQEPDQE